MSDTRFIEGWTPETGPGQEFTGEAIEWTEDDYRKAFPLVLKCEATARYAGQFVGHTNATEVVFSQAMLDKIGGESPSKKVIEVFAEEIGEAFRRATARLAI